MNLFQVPGGNPEPALRALKTVAMANGTFADGERALLIAAANAYRAVVDVDALKPITPEDLAAAIPDKDDRVRVLQASMLMSLADREATKDEWTVLDSFRRALGVDESRMKMMHHLSKGNLRLARFHMFRASTGMRAQMASAGVGNLLRAAGVLPPNQQLAQKFRGLEILPEGTLGREFVRYIQRNGFSYPGEKGGIPEAIVHHDLTHVLTGYDTDPEGEVEIGSFTAGMKKNDPFGFLMFVMLEFGVGLALRPGMDAFPGHYDPERAFRAHQRGAACKRDLTDGWDFWAVVDRPVESLRREYGI